MLREAFNRAFLFFGANVLFTHWSIHYMYRFRCFATLKPIKLEIMYTVINKTQKTSFQYKGGFPNLEKFLNNGDKIIVISTYSNTIKVPYKEELNGEVEWEWESYPFKSLK